MTETSKSRLSSNLKISLISLIGLCIISICCVALFFVDKREIQPTLTPAIFALVSYYYPTGMLPASRASVGAHRYRQLFTVPIQSDQQKTRSS
jgi:flagellar basal body-associated protein FliL